MIVPCPVPADAPLARWLVGSADCAADGLLANGYAALAAPGGPVAATITGLLTLFVGFFAYRLLLGRGGLDAGSAAVAAVKIGFVLVLAGNWAVYQQVVARTLFDAPRMVADLMVGGLPRAGSVLAADPIDALGQVFDELMRDVRSLASHAGTASPLLGGLPFATMMLNAAAYVLVLAGAGVLAATRIGLALFLALGPVVAGLLLFEGTRGLVAGWLRAMVALAVTSFAVLVLVSVELTMLEPAVAALARERAIDAIRPETAMRASVIVGVFLIAKLGAMAASAMLGQGLRLPALVGGRREADRPRAATWGGAASVAIAGRAGVAGAGAIASPASGFGSSAPSRVPAASLGTALAAGDRWRIVAATPAPAAPGGAMPANHHHSRAVRPRRELLVARRKR